MIFIRTPTLDFCIYCIPKDSPMNEKKEMPSIFSKENYKWMLIGLAVMAIGMFLLSGGKSTDPNVFDKDEVYSFRRITLGPLVILAGLIIEIYAIFRKPKQA
jgi:Protein of unknown function (DUF3098)